ncbi:MAG: PTS lactose/cellobiose transporter subunit IIA [Erysipelotrichaceae bacterium]|nr:PTS lactose/cellobiose transporter subunit IIA [Erysipelotrichaceae bacterium]
MDAVQECMNMIAHAGEAKSLALLAITQARESNFTEAAETLKKADEALLLSHQAHVNLLFHDAQHQDLQVTIFMVHAADHLSSAETIRTIADEMIMLHREVKHA